MFEWTYLTSAINDRQRTVYKCDGVEIARLAQKVGGEWHAWLNQHLPLGDPRRRPRDCTNFETGKRGVELWAFRHAARIEAEVARVIANRPERPWMPRK